MLQLHERGSHRYFTFPELDQIPSFVHAVTHRSVTGVQPLPGPDGPWTASQRELMRALDVAADDLFFLRQMHSDRSIVASGPRPTGLKPPEADGVIWSRPGFFPVIRTADCVPVMVIAPEAGVAGAFHAGWRGTCAKVVEKGIELLLNRLGRRTSRIIATIGPAIRKCCYQVGSEVREAFEAANHEVGSLFEDDRLDLVAANRRQLEKAGITEILDCGLCTGCRTDLFFSWRKEKTDQRIWSLAGFRPDFGV